ncbi:hypothetical protein QWY99_01875 [Flavobacterium branchiarum]|uniref:Uncharacterized protein n=1 Tax=Flavobacterium branchiarum TaxID=1114870 RepID=A0ABV5FP46_9FLAO|nr:hypothetical protein [Flavobacterium branchiarum]MDN3671812.1 hypothetical protein [Flavobacterium branchiarum]
MKKNNFYRGVVFLQQRTLICFGLNRKMTIEFSISNYRCKPRLANNLKSIEEKEEIYYLLLSDNKGKVVKVMGVFKSFGN